MSCSDQKPFDLQGHRGCRGLMPENTIPAFLKAIELGVNTLEMDLGVTGDGQLVVSHEPYLSSEICLDTAGNPIPDPTQLSYNIYKMTYSELQRYDCGLKPHPRFPDQKKMAATKPLFEEVLRAVEATEAKSKIRYNIEIKSQLESDNLFHPAPAEFSDMVYNALEKSIGFDRVTIQSFDFRVLQYFHTHYPEVTLALLIENELPFEQNLDSIGFQPEIYSCDFHLLSRKSTKALQARGIKVIPWTVNDKAEMDHLVEWGVDGLITDYPDRFKN